MTVVPLDHHVRLPQDPPSAGRDVLRGEVRDPCPPSRVEDKTVDGENVD